MGRDKYENEELLKYGFPEDVWFHVDNLSSAHVYTRLNIKLNNIKGQTFKDMDPKLIEDCSQLVKANSLKGCKLPACEVLYTPFTNLKKTGDMADGQVGFYDENLRVKIHVERNNKLIKQIENTRKEVTVDLAESLKERQLLDKQARKAEYIERVKKEKEDMIEKKRLEDQQSYRQLFDKMNTLTNKQVESSVDASSAKKYEEDFM